MVDKVYSFYHEETGVTYYFADEVPNPLPADYVSDPQAYYDEFAVATIGKDMVVRNFWDTIQVQLSPNCTRAKEVVLAMLAFESNEAVKDSLP